MSYRKEVLRTAPIINEQKLMLNLGGMGIMAEAGEAGDVVKKHIFHEQPLDKDKLLKELGDVRWYMEVLLIAIDSSIEEIEKLNIEKLRARYPNGFNPKDSAAKKDEAKQ